MRVTPAVRFNQVSKKFRLDLNRPRSFQEVFVQRRLRAEPDWFWALQDLSFTIEPGEHVGLVGTNGSGKSTLLKLISRVIQPTNGTIETQGRVAGLLELGVGFHPDLTGRENIFLNASILGMSRVEVRRHLDDIIDFADIGPFINMQVRNYSSGMAVRLGFAITTALQPEVLLIDEVLAVGDADFQRKCLTRLEDLQTQGVTLLFVSHGLAQVQQLCERAIWISHGRVVADGEVEVVAGRYLDSTVPAATKRHDPQALAPQPSPGSQPEAPKSTNRWGTYQAEITRVELQNEAGECPLYFKTGDFLRLRLHYQAHIRIAQPTFGLAFYRHDGVHVNGPNSDSEGFHIDAIEGVGYTDYIVESLPLNAGVYEVTVAIYNRDSTLAYDHQHRAISLEVRATSLWVEAGVVHIPATWQHVPLAAKVEA
jgi:ABC-type polysaccharide/polyol phosphate transport system ATPase subunit